MVKSPSPVASLPRAGSTLYYSLLYCDAQSTQRAIDTLGFINTISSTLYEVSEPEVAEKKIHWWHEELARLAKRQARHPACIAVQDYLYASDTVQASLQILSAAATERYTPAATNQALNELLVADYAARVRLVNTALDNNALDIGVNQYPNPNNNINTIASGLGQFDRVHSLVKRLRCGYPVFSSEHYAAHHITPDALFAQLKSTASNNTDEQVNASQLLRASVNDALAAIEQAVSVMSSVGNNNASINTNVTKLPMYILCHLRAAQLRLWKKRQPDLLHEYVAVTPVRKFIMAYRCRQRFQKRSSKTNTG